MTDAMADGGTKKKRSALTIVLMVIGVLVGGTCLIGVLAAIAIPAFIGYINRAKTSEARANVMSIHSAVEGYVEGDPGRGLPPSLARTPSTIPCGAKQPWPIDADPAWAELGFAPVEPGYYSYSVDVSPNGRDFTVRAEGDLDCDGATSLFELRGQLDPESGAVTREGDLVVTDELE